MIIYPSLSLSVVGQSPPVIPGITGGILVGNFGADKVFGASAPITSIGLVCALSAGAVLTFSVQVSGDDPSNIVNWVNHNMLNGLNVSTYGQIIYPVSAIRLSVTAHTSGSVSLGIVQWP